MYETFLQNHEKGNLSEMKSVKPLLIILSRGAHIVCKHNKSKNKHPPLWMEEKSNQYLK